MIGSRSWRRTINIGIMLPPRSGYSLARQKQRLDTDQHRAFGRESMAVPRRSMSHVANVA